MSRCRATFTHVFIGCTLLLSLAVTSHAWEPKNSDLDAAITSGAFDTYFKSISTWINQKASADLSKTTEESLKALLQDPVFAKVLAQRQFIAKLGVEKLDAFAQADQANKTFLAWLLPNTWALDLYLLGATPTGIEERERNDYAIDAASLDIWKNIFAADADSREGIYLKLAIATALNPPGTGTQGAGGAKEHPARPVARYQHFKAAHKNQELFATFDDLTVWEYRQIVSSCASDSDLAWARKMLNTWRPDLRVNQQVVNSTSEVWRRNSPFLYTEGFKSVLAGGGKCGPRSSWGVMICQAFGIPAIGVSQPGHACIAYKAVDHALEPQPGKIWKVAYGRDWHVSKLQGLSGPDFLAGMAERSRAAEFSQVEQLRWLASTLTSAEQAAAVKSIVQQIRQAKDQQELQAKADSTKTDPLVASKSEAPFKAVPGVLHVEAESFAGMSGMVVLDCAEGGKQVNFQKNMEESWIDYSLDVPATGVYELTARTATPNFEQVLDVRLDASKLATVKIPNSHGLWETTEKVTVKLEKGMQTLRLSAPFQRGVALRWLELRSS